MGAVIASVAERDIALENREESYFEANERDIYERHDLDYKSTVLLRSSVHKPLLEGHCRAWHVQALSYILFPPLVYYTVQSTQPTPRSRLEA